MPALAGLLTGAAALAVGCGGGDEGVPTGDISKAQYVERADRICAAGDRRLDAAADRYFGEQLGLTQAEDPSEEQLATFIEETLIPNIQGQLDDLRELEAPEAGADQIDEIYEVAQEELDEVADDPGALADEDADPFKEANKLAHAYGLEACGG